MQSRNTLAWILLPSLTFLSYIIAIYFAIDATDAITKSVDIAVSTLEDTSQLPTIQKIIGENEECIHVVITPGMILAKIKQMKDNKPPGVDGISSKMLKEIAEEISVPLIYVQEEVVPHEWKIANVVPILKKCFIDNYYQWLSFRQKGTYVSRGSRIVLRGEGGGAFWKLGQTAIIYRVVGLTAW